MPLRDANWWYGDDIINANWWYDNDMMPIGDMIMIWCQLIVCLCSHEIIPQDVTGQYSVHFQNKKRNILKQKYWTNSLFHVFPLNSWRDVPLLVHQPLLHSHIASTTKHHNLHVNLQLCIQEWLDIMFFFFPKWPWTYEGEIDIWLTVGCGFNFGVFNVHCSCLF